MAPPSKSQIGPISYNKKSFESSRASEFLTRLQTEFNPILAKRGWTVAKLSELCCCFGGKLGKNFGIGGFCMPDGSGTHSRGIYLRLRSPNNNVENDPTKFDVGHAFVPWETMVKVMAHECAHIQHGKHSVQFYDLMEELFQEHQGLYGSSGSSVGSVINRGSGSSSGMDGMDGEGVTLGGGGSLPQGKFRSKEDERRHQADAATRRQNQSKIMGGGTLGGSSANPTPKPKDPRAAAALAAIRREEDMWCQECEDLTLDDSDSDCNSDIEIDDAQQQQQQSEKKRKISEQVIDLCGSSQEDSQGDCTFFDSPLLLPPPLSKRNKQNSLWTCAKCTLQNTSNVSTVKCAACGTLRNCELVRLEEASLSAIREIETKDKIEIVKRNEIERATKTFGFNVYASSNSGG